MVPVITMTGLQLGSIIAFAIITETRVPVAGHGAVVHQGDPVRRYPDHGGLPGADLVDVRGHQPDRGLLYVAIDPRLRVDRREAMSMSAPANTVQRKKRLAHRAADSDVAQRSSARP
jgi:hypothetical protein